jgi:small subunit ribosomal protein S13
MQKENKPKGDYKHLVRIANTDVDGSKTILYALTKIKGISHMFANAVLSIAHIDKEKKAGVLSEAEVKKVDEIVRQPEKFEVPTWMLNRRKDYDSGEDKHLLTSDLDFTKDNDLKRLKKVKSYRGLRHAWNLPVRGQKTKSNFRHNKGKVMGVKRKK